MEGSLFHEVIEQAPLGIVVLAPDLSVRYMNRSGLVLHNIPEQAAVESIKFDQIVVEPESVRAPLALVLEERIEPLIMPYEVGSELPRKFISAAVGRIECDTGDICLVLVAEDVTARKQLETEVVETEKSSLLGQLVVTLQHEVNNQLQVIIGQADVAIASEALPDALRSNLSEIRRSAQRIAARLHYLAGLDRVETAQYLDHVRMIRVETDEQ